MDNWQVRTQSLIGIENLKRINECTVAVFGLGGVGSYTVEGLARAGVGNLVLCDGDVVSVSNINRQLYALHSTIGKKKTEVARERVLDINPECNVQTHDCFFKEENLQNFDFSKFDYVVDCIDMVSSKILLIEKCKECDVPIICAMGAGNKLDATMFEVADISKTSVCPLAKVIRTELKKRNLQKVKVVYSKETAKTPVEEVEADSGYKKRNSPASISFVPSTMGLILAGEVVKSFIV